jgi:hypothetical protein
MADRPQSYAAHAHNPWPTTVATVFVTVAVVAFIAGEWLERPSLVQLGLYALALSVCALVAISRMYITALQDRIIRLEERLRLKELLPVARHAEILRLSTKQLVALRFASDHEVPALVTRALEESLSPKQIKQAIVTWRPDYERT